MPSNPYTFPQVDRLIHEPARLAILTVLSNCTSADFLFLQNATGLSKGNLSVQISKLEESGFVRVVKEIRKKKTLTTVSLAREGRSAIKEYWQTMEAIRRQTNPARG